MFSSLPGKTEKYDIKRKEKYQEDGPLRLQLDCDQMPERKRKGKCDEEEKKRKKGRKYYVSPRVHYIELGGMEEKKRAPTD